MSMGINLQLRQSQSLVMTPQLQQAIKLLQMSNLDLAEFVNQELEKNPFLEVASPTPDERRSGEEPSNAAASNESAAAKSDTSTELSTDNLGRAEETFDNGLDNVYADESHADRQADAAAAQQGNEESAAWASIGKGSNSRFDSGEFDLESSLVAEKSLRDHLLDQLGITMAEPRIRAIAAYLIEYIDEAGYLKVEDETIAELLGASIDDVQRAVAILQKLDPSGIAARDLADCIRLQLRDLNRLDPAMEMMVDNLPMLAEGKMQKLMKLCEVGPEDMRDMIAEIRALDPKPGTRFYSEIAQTMIPDAFVRKNSLGGWSVELNADTLPKVLVNSRYAAEVAKGGASVKDYLTENMQSANWLAKSLDQRARTILKVSTEIVRQQDGFLEFGISELRPLNLKTVADAIGMHESTVSRVTSNKYLSTTRGVFELKFFFTASISSVDGGESHSAESVRHKLKTMIDAEDPKAILSDDKLVKMLRGDGIDIARRTVAKYRESMDIPSSVQRRRLKSQPF